MRQWDQPGGLPRGARHLLRCTVASDVLEHCRGLMPGDMPACLLRWAEELVKTHVDWREVWRAEIRRGLAVVGGMVDYSYARPSRPAAILDEVILPGFVRPVPEVAVVVDTSTAPALRPPPSMFAVRCAGSGALRPPPSMFAVRCAGSGALRPPGPVAAPRASSLRAPSRPEIGRAHV